MSAPLTLMSALLIKLIIKSKNGQKLKYYSYSVFVKLFSVIFMNEIV